MEAIKVFLLNYCPPRLLTVRFRNNCQQDQSGRRAIRKLPDDQQELKLKGSMI
jgi:hypothetical protein